MLKLLPVFIFIIPGMIALALARTGDYGALSQMVPGLGWSSARVPPVLAAAMHRRVCMAGKHATKDIERLIVWLEADDASNRPTRAKRLRDLLEILPVPPEGLSFLGGEASKICFDEVRRCYLDGSNMAVVLLCLAYVERELAADLYAAGWDAAGTARLGELLKEAYKGGGLSELEWETYRELGRLRNSHAHFRAPGSPTSMGARIVGENALGTEVLAKDARRAVQAMARIVKRQSGMRVALGAPDQ